MHSAIRALSPEGIVKPVARTSCARLGGRKKERKSGGQDIAACELAFRPGREEERYLDVNCGPCAGQRREADSALLLAKRGGKNISVSPGKKKGEAKDEKGEASSCRRGKEGGSRFRKGKSSVRLLRTMGKKRKRERTRGFEVPNWPGLIEERRE